MRQCEVLSVTYLYVYVIGTGTFYITYVIIALVELCDQDPAFLYGLGITYFHFSAYQWYVLCML